MFFKGILTIWQWRREAQSASAKHWARGTAVLAVVTWI